MSADEPPPPPRTSRYWGHYDYVCPACGVERLDVEEVGHSDFVSGGIVFDAEIEVAYLDECPNCGSESPPIRRWPDAPTSSPPDTTRENS